MTPVSKIERPIVFGLFVRVYVCVFVQQSKKIGKMHVLLRHSVSCFNIRMVIFFIFLIYGGKHVLWSLLESSCDCQMRYIK